MLLGVCELFGGGSFGPFRETRIVGSRVVAICLSRYAVVRFLLEGWDYASVYEVTV